MSGEEPTVRDAIVSIICDMLDNPDKAGIYPTTRAFDALEQLFAERLRALERENKRLHNSHDELFPQCQKVADRLRERVAELERELCSCGGAHYRESEVYQLLNVIDGVVELLHQKGLVAHRYNLDAVRHVLAENAQLRADSERLEWWFGEVKEDPSLLINEYLKGMREGWDVDQWRAFCDRHRQPQAEAQGGGEE